MVAPLLLAGLAALGGGLLDQYNGRKVLRKQNEQVRRGIEETRQKQREASLRLAQSLDQIEAPQDNEGESLGRYMEGLRRSKPTTLARGISDDYDVLAGGAQQDVANYGNDMAGTFAALDTPARQRMNERNIALDTGTDFDRLRDQVQTQQYLRQLRINSIRPNYWLELASSGLRGLAPAAAMGAFGGASVPQIGTGSSYGGGLASAAAVDPYRAVSVFGAR